MARRLPTTWSPSVPPPSFGTPFRVGLRGVHPARGGPLPPETRHLRTAPARRPDGALQNPRRLAHRSPGQPIGAHRRRIRRRTRPPHHAPEYPVSLRPAATRGRPHAPFGRRRAH